MTAMNTAIGMMNEMSCGSARIVTHTKAKPALRLPMMMSSWFRPWVRMAMAASAPRIASKGPSTCRNT